MNTPTTNTPLSACCHAPMVVGGDDIEGTHYYICTKCKNICDVGILDHLSDNNDRISLCESCYCMTHTIDGACRKCGAVKPEPVSSFEQVGKNIDAPTKAGGEENYYSLTNFMSRVLPAYDEARIEKKYIQGLTPQQWVEKHLSNYIAQLISQARAAQKVETFNLRETTNKYPSMCKQYVDTDRQDLKVICKKFAETFHIGYEQMHIKNGAALFQTDDSDFYGNSTITTRVEIWLIIQWASVYHDISYYKSAHLANPQEA